MGEEGGCGGELQRAAGRFAAAGGAHPAGFHEGVYGAFGDGDAADVFDFGAGGGLVIGDDGEGFEGGAGEFFRHFAGVFEDRGAVGGGLEEVAAAAFDEIDAARGIIGSKGGEGASEIAFAGVGADVFRAERLGGGEQDGFDAAGVGVWISRHRLRRPFRRTRAETGRRP